MGINKKQIVLVMMPHKKVIIWSIIILIMQNLRIIIRPHSHLEKLLIRSINPSVRNMLINTTIVDELKVIPTVSLLDASGISMAISKHFKSIRKSYR